MRLLSLTVTTPNWEEAESQSDIHLVSLGAGVSSSRQLTYTEDKNETSPTWAPDGSFFLFSSNRDGDSNQLYMMRHDGGEARKITDAKEGVSGFAFSPGGRWLVYRSGESDQEQLSRLPAGDLAGAEPEQLTDGEKRRREEGFTVDIRNAVTPLSSLWSVEVLW